MSSSGYKIADITDAVRDFSLDNPGALTSVDQVVMCLGPNDIKFLNSFKFDVPCDEVKMSIGLERHGNSKKKHALSVIDYDKFIVNKTNL